MRIILCGFGVVAQSFTSLLESRASELYSRYGLKPRIIGVFDSKGSACDNAGLNLKKLIDVKKKSGSVRGYNSKSQMTGIEMIKTLIDKGYAYVTDDGSVFFSIDAYEDYGALSNIDMNQAVRGDRVASDEYNLDNPSDFALWKSYKK